MVQVSQRTGFTGSALIHLLARLTHAEAPESRQAFADRLSQWLGWTDAISLSAALDGNLAIARSRTRAPGNAAEAECNRVRAALANAITEDSVFTTTDFPPYRQRYLARQQAMETGIDPLRARLQGALAARSPDMARLAAVDVVMAQALGSHERRLLSTVPTLLEKHFERLRQAHTDSPPEVWLDLFRTDMQAVLLAELDIRLQPVEGLLEALRTS